MPKGSKIDEQFSTFMSEAMVRQLKKKVEAMEKEALSAERPQKKALREYEMLATSHWDGGTLIGALKGLIAHLESNPGLEAGVGHLVAEYTNHSGWSIIMARYVDG